MRQNEIDKWQKIIKNGQSFMKEKMADWDDLYARYNLDLHVAGMKDEHVVRVSRFYPLSASSSPL